MKDMFKNMVDCLTKTQITKHYDSETKFTCGCCEGAPFTVAMKGDFTITAAQVLAACAIMSVMCISAAVVKKLKK